MDKNTNKHSAATDNWCIWRWNWDPPQNTHTHEMITGEQEKIMMHFKRKKYYSNHESTISVSD